MTEPAEHVTVLAAPAVPKIQRLVERVNRRKASAVGLLASVADRLHTVLALMYRASLDNARITKDELALTKAFVIRLERRAQELANQRAGGMAEAVSILKDAARQLDEADHGGYKVKSVQRQAEGDRKTLARLLASMKARVAESAAVLAELEQAVDPIPGMRIVSGRQRAVNAKRRKEAARPEVAGTLPLP